MKKHVRFNKSWIQLTVIVFLLAMLPAAAFASFAGGEGTVANPYQIATAEQLNSVREEVYLDKHFVQVGDIDLSVYGAVYGWEPIGTLTAPFTGTFDGGGYTISGLVINRPEEDYVGLFGYVGYGSVLQNVGLPVVNVTGRSLVGGLAGSNFGTINGSYVTGTVSCNGNGVGGLTGKNNTAINNSYADVVVSGSLFQSIGGLAGVNPGSISNSYAIGDVQGAEFVGGLVGWSQNNGTIENSYATGRVSGSGMNIGGLVGRNTGIIRGSYAEGGVEGTNSVGGLVGENGYSINGGIIENSYATGNVDATNARVGGLVGSTQHAGSAITGSYATGNVIGGHQTGGLVGKVFDGVTISNNYALNTNIIRKSVSASTTFGRIAGESSGILLENWANTAMTEPFVGAYTVKTHDGKDGADLDDWSITHGTLMVNSATILMSDPLSPEENQDFTFTVQVRDVVYNPVSGLGAADFTIYENGAGSLTVISVVEDGVTGNYTVTASHNTAETITITVYALNVQVGIIEDVVILEATPVSGDLYSFGSGFNYRLGLGEDTTNKTIPTRIMGLSQVKAVAAGAEHTLVLLANGDVYVFGNGSLGRLGTGDTANRPSPTKINLAGPAKAVAAGDRHSLVLLENGDVYSFGYGGNGQLGHGDTGNATVPVKVQALSEVRIKAISALSNHSLVLSENGEVYSFGAGGNGRLGHGDEINRSTPTKIEGLTGVKAIAAGGTHSLVLLEDGSVYSFGNGGHGRLGHAADTNDKLVPTRITRIDTLPEVKDIAAGLNHSLVVLHNGDAYSFGFNSYGQLGHGSNVSEFFIPTRIASLSGVKSIIGGGSHTLALLDNGDVYSFGRNNKGQLGLDNNFVDIFSPVKIGSMSDVAAIAAGYEHSLVVVGSVAPTPISDDDAVAADKATLTFETIKGENASLESITNNLNLVFGGAKGTTITWSVNPDDGWINTATGTVTRPSFSEEDKTVTLTATITKGTASDTKSFTLTIIALPISADEAIALDLEALTWDSIKATNSIQDSVTESLVNPLPTAGANGTTISWSANNSWINTVTGAVSRPTYSEGNKTVTLTATFSKQGGTDQAKSFTLTIKAQAQTGSVGYSSGLPSNGISKRIFAADGGNLQYDDVIVMVPPVVLPTDTTVTIVKVTTTEMNSLVPEGLRVKLGSSIYEITTSGTSEFGDKTITIKIAYNPDHITEGDQPIINYYDEEARQWVALDTTTEYDETTGTYYAITRVNHLTKFAVFSSEAKKKTITLAIGDTAATVGELPYTLDAAPVMDAAAGRTLIPIRFVAEVLGAQVEWIKQSNQVRIVDGSKEIILTIGSTSVTVDGSRSTIDSAPVIMAPGRTFVPVRFICETLGATVYYNDTTKQVIITK